MFASTTTSKPATAAHGKDQRDEVGCTTLERFSKYNSQ
jgi:hypothetical protein